MAGHCDPRIASPKFRTHMFGTGGSTAGLGSVGESWQTGELFSAWERSGQPAVGS